MVTELEKAKMSEISVIIPAFNAQDFIGDAIESALRQTSNILEIIVVDDGSKDNTVEIVNSFNNRVSLICQPNQGSGCARNTGIYRCQGKWVAFLDADDLWEENHIETLFKALCLNPTAALVYSGKNWIDKNGNDLSVEAQTKYPSGWIFGELIESNYISGASCVMARRDILINYNGFRPDPVYPPNEDYELWLRIAATHPVAATSCKTVRYRRHENNQTVKRSKYATGHLASLRSGCSLLVNGKVHAANKPYKINPRDRLCRAYREAITSTFYFNDYRASRCILKEMLRDRIFDLRSIFVGILCYLPEYIVHLLRRFRRRFRWTNWA